MTIQTEINRISGNIANALEAVAEKGVTVPSGSNSDSLASLIGSIETGSLTITDDGAGNVTLSIQNAVVTDDGNGNVTVTSN